MSKRDCPCEICKDCDFISSIHLIDPCPSCLSRHEEYDDYESGLGIKENKEWGNIPDETVSNKSSGGNKDV